MRLYKYLNEEDIIKKALSVDEPDIGVEYTNDEVKEKLHLLSNAIKLQSNMVSKDDENEMLKAVLNDLMDKEKKWKNWKNEVKSKGPNPSPEELAAQAAVVEEP